MKPHKVSRIIVACAVLHNFAVDWQMGDEFEENDEPPEQPPLQPYNGPNDGQGNRAHITNTFFR